MIQERQAVIMEAAVLEFFGLHLVVKVLVLIAKRTLQTLFCFKAITVIFQVIVHFEFNGIL
jgi:hypothetical protein